MSEVGLHHPMSTLSESSMSKENIRCYAFISNSWHFIYDLSFFLPNLTQNISAV